MATERSVVIFQSRYSWFTVYPFPASAAVAENVMVAVELTLPLLYCSDYLS